MVELFFDVTYLVQLTKAEFIGQGSGRTVYRHPYHQYLVIKLPRVRNKNWFGRLERKMRFLSRRFGAFKHSILEAEEYTAMIARNNEIPDFVPAYRGMIATNLGIGAAFEIVQQPDGTIAPNLRNYVKQQGMTPELRAAIDAFWDKVVRFRCVVSDPSLANILVQTDVDGGLHLWIVDGIGEQAFIPVSRMFDAVYRHTTKGMRQLFEDKLRKSLASKMSE